MSDDDDSDQENTNEQDAEMVANQIFGDDDNDDAPDADQDETSQSSARAAAEAADAYGDLDNSEESGMWFHMSKFCIESMRLFLN